MSEEALILLSKLHTRAFQDFKLAIAEERRRLQTNGDDWVFDPADMRPVETYRTED